LNNLLAEQTEKLRMRGKFLKVSVEAMDEIKRMKSLTLLLGLLWEILE
jgi:hypothetical protein